MQAAMLVEHVLPVQEDLHGAALILQQALDLCMKPTTLLSGGQMCQIQTDRT